MTHPLSRERLEAALYDLNAPEIGYKDIFVKHGEVFHEALKFLLNPEPTEEMLDALASGYIKAASGMYYYDPYKSFKSLFAAMTGDKK